MKHSPLQLFSFWDPGVAHAPEQSWKASFLSSASAWLKLLQRHRCDWWEQYCSLADRRTEPARLPCPCPCTTVAAAILLFLLLHLLRPVAAAPALIVCSYCEDFMSWKGLSASFASGRIGLSSPHSQRRRTHAWRFLNGRDESFPPLRSHHLKPILYLAELPKHVCCTAYLRSNFIFNFLTREKLIEKLTPHTL